MAEIVDWTAMMEGVRIRVGARLERVGMTIRGEDGGEGCIDNVAIAGGENGFEVGLALMSVEPQVGWMRWMVVAVAVCGKIVGSRSCTVNSSIVSLSGLKR